MQTNPWAQEDRVMEQHSNSPAILPDASVKSTEKRIKRQRVLSEPRYASQIPDYDLRQYKSLVSTERLTEGGPPFGATTQYCDLLTNDHSKLAVQIFAHIDRGFFLHNFDWTCYRRNYFKVSVCFGFDRPTYPDTACLIKTATGTEKVVSFAACIRAQVTNGSHPIELVQHTAKRDKGPQKTPEPCILEAGGNINITHSDQPNTATFERIQFKVATANNGKRRAAQQYYCVVVVLYANTETGSTCVGCVRSAPLVVRGRSPGHYADIQRGSEKSSEPELRHHYRFMSLPNTPINDIPFAHPYPPSFMPPVLAPFQHPMQYTPFSYYPSAPPPAPPAPSGLPAHSTNSPPRINHFNAPLSSPNGTLYSMYRSITEEEDKKESWESQRPEGLSNGYYYQELSQTRDTNEDEESGMNDSHNYS
ncbi:hypothetical protein BDF14DRAFT_1881282 [Spinellus fusiger]|nr:hypothetical protein BDF14DRAFT_1881282 [Spinellus fusiger]